LAENADAVLMAWEPGTMGGAAIADVLFGDENPSAKLPVSFPRTVGQVPLYYSHKSTGRPLPRNRHFSRYLDALDTPLYPFGYGLSYTTFEYSRLVVTPASSPVGGPITVLAAVTNTGTRAGEEIVQLYIRDCVASMVRPVKELKGFQKIHLEPDQTQIVEFTLGPDELGFYGRDNTWVVEPGAFQVWVGPNSSEGLEGAFRLESTLTARSG
jgi:beta-glucosidase